MTFKLLMCPLVFSVNHMALMKGDYFNSIHFNRYLPVPITQVTVWRKWLDPVSKASKGKQRPGVQKMSWRRNAIIGGAENGGSTLLAGFWKEVSSYIGKRRDMKEDWMKQQRWATAGLNLKRESCDLGHREKSKQRGSGTEGLVWAQQWLGLKIHSVGKEFTCQ